MERESPNSRLPPIDNRAFRAPEPVVASSHSHNIACNTYKSI